jgi:hypothetical protein
VSEPEQSWAYKVTAAVAKLADVTSIRWGSKGNWRSRHVTALTDLTLPSRDDPYTVDEGETIYIDKRSYPDGPYELPDRRKVPAGAAGQRSRAALGWRLGGALAYAINTVRHHGSRQGITNTAR